ncbi:MAG: hypothetical protein A2144_00780 [Chloroflexi bacterium RBG_16_50_9]|nr:MAG: hypothetical protein A2144_00780 [Chloroflexi bacterium RBG_16_50_9]
MIQKLALEIKPYKSIFRVAGILRSLSEGVNTVTEIANHHHLSKSTVSRLLQALEESNLAIQDPTSRKFYLGNLITQIFANPKTAHMDLVLQAIDEMKHLNELTGETVFLSVIVGIQYIRLNEITSKQELRVSVEGCDLTGPQFVGATAKVLLSQLNSQALKLAMKYYNSARTPHDSLNDAESFLAQLKQIKRQGYAISYGERILGSISISAPIKNYTFPAALSIVGPDIRLKTKKDDLTANLTKSAWFISNNIADYMKVNARRFSK